MWTLRIWFRIARITRRYPDSGTHVEHKAPGLSADTIFEMRQKAGNNLS
jgi:hypothetical protein